jgi:hypothetical protein
VEGDIFCITLIAPKISRVIREKALIVERREARMTALSRECAFLVPHSIRALRNSMIFCFAKILDHGAHNTNDEKNGVFAAYLIRFQAPN